MTFPNPNVVGPPKKDTILVLIPEHSTKEIAAFKADPKALCGL